MLVGSRHMNLENLFLRFSCLTFLTAVVARHYSGYEVPKLSPRKQYPLIRSMGSCGIRLSSEFGSEFDLKFSRQLPISSAHRAEATSRYISPGPFSIRRDGTSRRPHVAIMGQHPFTIDWGRF